MDTILYIKTYFTQKTPFNCTEQQKNTFHKDTTWKVTTSEENRLYGHIFNNIPFLKTFILSYLCLSLNPFTLNEESRC